MAISLDPPVRPKAGQTVKVLLITRVSKLKPGATSNKDQATMLRRWLDHNLGAPYEIVPISGKGSGEILDRAESAQAHDAVESGAFDLVLCEDLGRVFRRVHAYVFCEHCQDHDTRLIAVNDSVDTARDDWPLSAFFAVVRHESYNRDTAARIRRSQRSRFAQGGVFGCPTFAYIKRPGAKGDADVFKDMKAQPILEEWFRRLEDEATYAEIADWLNKLGVPTGPYCRLNKWDGRMVARITHNPILKGVRVRNDKMSRRINKSGHRRSVKAPPEERLERFVPHLAFFEAGYYDRVLRIVDARNSKFRRKGINGKDHRKGASRKRSVWPGQHLRCGVCCRFLHWTGLQSVKELKCSGAHNYQCWNSILLNGPKVAQKLVAAIMAEIRSLPDFDEVLIAGVQEKLNAIRDTQCGQRHELDARRQEIAQQISRVTEAIATMENSRALFDKLKKLETERDQLGDRVTELVQNAPAAIRIPSAAEIRTVAAKVLPQFKTDDPEFCRMMKRLIPDLRVYPYRLCDGGAVVLRAKFTLCLTALHPDAPRSPDMNGVLSREMLVDLFDLPQRALFRNEVVSLRAAGFSEKEVARRLGITKTAAQKAASLDRRMQELGLTDPYVLVTEPPVDYGKLRRHRHPRYRFEPLDDTSLAICT